MVGLVVLLLSSAAFEEDDFPAVGQKVVTKQTTPLKEGDRVVDEDRVFRVYTVERVDGERLRLVAGKVSGWVPANSVVLFDRAIDYFTRVIEDDPDAAGLRPARQRLKREEGIRQGDRRSYRGDPARPEFGPAGVLADRGGVPGTGRASTTRRLPISTKRSASTPAGGSTGPRYAWSWKGDRTRRSSITPRRSGSTPTMPGRTTSGGMPGTKE